MHAIQSALARLIDRHDLTAEEMQAAVGCVMDGQASEVEIAALLTALRTKGETVAEVVGAARAMNERAVRIESGLTGLLDTCGTGGDRLSTFNISTATAFVVAATGVPVAKHGNRSVSSSSGSADVLEALGVNIQLSPERIVACLHEVGLAFCFAPLIHGAMQHAAPVRRQLGFRTIFNLLGPLTNPAGAEFQLIGCHRPETAELLAQAVRQLGRTRAIVVCGEGGLDEVGLWGETTVFVVEGAAITEERWTADTFGLPACDVLDLRAESAVDSAGIIRRVLAGEAGPHRHMILANAAAALRAAGRADDPLSAVEAARQAIDSGKARELCERLVAWTSA